MEIFDFIAQVGAPIAAALIMGFFIFQTLKYILEGVLDQVKMVDNFTSSLVNRVKTMNNDLIRIDTLVSHALNVNPDIERIARADGKDDARRDGCNTAIWLSDSNGCRYGILHILYLEVCYRGGCSQTRGISY